MLFSFLLWTSPVILTILKGMSWKRYFLSVFVKMFTFSNFCSSGWVTDICIPEIYKINKIKYGGITLFHTWTFSFEQLRWRCEPKLLEMLWKNGRESWIHSQISIATEWNYFQIPYHRQILKHYHNYKISQ